MIYDHILSHETRHIPASSTCEPIYANQPAHYWRTEYVGRTMLAELLVFWYGFVRLHLGLDIGFLERFLTARVNVLDMPRYCLLSKISITLDQRDLMSCKSASPGDKASFSPRKRLLQRLEYLFQLKEGVSIHIYAYRPIGRTYMLQDPRELLNDRERLLREVTAPISDTLARMKDCGYSIAIAVKDCMRDFPPQVHQLYHLEYVYDVAAEDIYCYTKGEINVVLR